MQPNQEPNGQNQPQPVAYDQQGRPLYAHPPQTPHPQMVYVARPMQPHPPHVPEEIKKRAEESEKKYPQLNLSNGEYIISAVKRHPIGLVKIWALIFIMMAAFTYLFGTFIINPDTASSVSPFGDGADGMQVLGTVLLAGILVLCLFGGFVATYVYNNNTFFLTNESVIQEIQSGPFNKHEQTVSLANIEDASYKQNGILPHLLNYGTIRLSTEGDETTYRFNYVSNPKKHIAKLNNAVEAFKNGRPVNDGLYDN